MRQLAPDWFAAGNQGGLFAPVEADGLVYASCAASEICAYADSSGKVLWRRASAGVGSPLVTGGLLIGTCADAAELCAFNAVTARPVRTAVLAGDGHG
ncbi:MAG: PQQ-binding-like beta-propeller repeat protein [Streptosporangiaceae bacterium]